MISNLVFDVGLHMGEDTNFYLKKGYRVVAFEANPDLVESCKLRFAKEIGEGQLNIVEGAIGPKGDGSKLTFYKSERSIWGSISSEWSERNSKWGIGSKTIEVNRVDFVQSVNDFGVPFFLKIDIEGADHLVLDALTNCIEKPQHISIEAEKVNYSELEEQVDRLFNLGYRKFRAVQQSWMRGSEIKTEDLHGNRFTHIFEEHSSGPFGPDVKQEWVSKDALLSDFKKIFRFYRMLGDGAFVHQVVPMSRHVIYAASKIVGRPLVGWHDIHASLP